MPNLDQNKSAPITKRDKILLGVLGLLYLTPGVLIICDQGNPFDVRAQVIFIIWENQLAFVLSLLASILCILLISSKSIWCKFIGLFCILLPLFTIYISFPLLRYFFK